MLVHVNTPLGVCDPYEEPVDADLRIDTSVTPLEKAVDAVLGVLDLPLRRA